MLHRAEETNVTQLRKFVKVDLFAPKGETLCARTCSTGLLASNRDTHRETYREWHHNGQQLCVCKHIHFSYTSTFIIS